MIKGITFDKQLMRSKDHAHEINHYFQGKVGVTKGCNVSENVDGNLVVSSGYFIIGGRLVSVESPEIITIPSVPSGLLYSILVFEIDLTKTNTLTEFNQGVFKILSDAADYPVLIQQDLENDGTMYQFEFVRFENSSSGIASLVDTRTLLDMGIYATRINAELGGISKAPTAPIGTDTEQIANAAFVQQEIAANAYTLPAASASVRGGVKVSLSGTTLTITTT